MAESPGSVKFRDLCIVCDHYFGSPRQTGGSHKIYKTPWAGDPRINLQQAPGGMAKIYQINQVLAALKRLRAEKEHEPKV
jgi:hypothetical protein